MRKLVLFIAILFLFSGCITNSSLNICSSQHMQSAEHNVASAESKVNTELQSKIEKTINKDDEEGGIVRRFLKRVF